MKTDLKTARQTLKAESRAYQVYSYYLAIPILFIGTMIVTYFGYSNNSIGVVILVLTIFAHVGASKLKLASKRKYVAPILMYIANVIALVLMPVLFSDMSAGGNGDSYFALIGLIVVPIEIITIIFFFISAHDLKKAYPTMKQDTKQARETYKQLKQTSKLNS
ncbi:hypothetical protein ACFQH1_11320 [Lactiplantibacillus daoliensis]|uniref:Integral membrane protein n=1 Tax=Lactiplantibacillus daoliensis TaxID=2559916 RepID=A0ABW1UI50_9LACO|nr:hypothetical protein [Lactiplantibacillus daoliensis]